MPKFSNVDVKFYETNHDLNLLSATFKKINSIPPSKEDIEVSKQCIIKNTSIIKNQNEIFQNHIPNITAINKLIKALTFCGLHFLVLEDYNLSLMCFDRITELKTSYSFEFPFFYNMYVRTLFQNLNQAEKEIVKSPITEKVELRKIKLD